MALIVPSTARWPNPPGTIVQSKSRSFWQLFLSSNSRELNQVNSGFRLSCQQACLTASITEMYESDNVNFPVSKYLPIMPIFSGSFFLFNFCKKLFHSRSTKGFEGKENFSRIFLSTFCS